MLGSGDCISVGRGELWWGTWGQNTMKTNSQQKLANNILLPLNVVGEKIHIHRNIGTAAARLDELAAIALN